MTKEINLKLKKFFSWLLILSVINLLIISIIPWIAVEDDSNGRLYFNNIMMERSENVQIKNIANYLFFINLLLCFIIIISSISYISFSIFDISENYQRFTKIIIISGYITIVVSILITSLIINLLKKISEMDSVTLASVYLDIKFAYAPVAIGFFLLIVSILYTYYIIFNVLRQKESLKTNEKQVNEKLIFNKKEPFVKKIISDNNFDIRNLKFADGLNLANDQNIDLNDKTKLEILDAKNLIKEEKSIENEQIQNLESLKSKDKIILEPFPPEKLKEKTKQSNELQTSKQFEKALYSAIEKKHDEIKKQVPIRKKCKTNYEKNKEIIPQAEIQIEKTEDSEESKKNESKKKIYIKCPHCKFIFILEDNGNKTIIKCPNCGVEGAIKYLNEIVRC